MPELIDSQALLVDIEKEIEFLTSSPGNHDYFDYAKKNGLVIAKNIVGRQPAIETEPVRHGRWKLGSKADNACVIPSDLEFYCTCCGKEAIHDYDDTQVLSDFCPHCGARMDADHIADDSKKVGGNEDAESKTD